MTRPLARTIQGAVAEHFGITVDDLLGPARHRHVARPRQIAMYLVKDMTIHSTVWIGKAFGGRDHSTVLSAVTRVRELMVDDPEFKQDVDQIVERISGGEGCDL